MNGEIYNLASRLVAIASEKGVTIAFAESCTGGLIAASITDVPGASAVFLGSAVTYSNEAKHDILGVSASTLSERGAVSSECAGQMAAGARRIYGSDVALSVTGIAGPDGGSAEKPVGTVWFGFASRNKNISFVRRFDGGRDDIRKATVMTAISAVIEELA